ncbi:cyclic-di-GMP-binding biofilm dispersal mediator protein [Variibacter gotjawalensis]|uniref:Cyclic-di-GMP-binding biofilm dispersal mediator protein n=1 Tax=Variibacter gotjawalensis TaxID=1333996 RepID=A0A0S3PVH2_9BRAD|nr:3-oxoacyl-ACP reductase family protein [Variibacter gotjawalensis]NIK45776.1 NAD(P)-dependent dehydrogenase (short-subunit alcohol dehydrogenase family) [Variibacter gotjawalensis]RZS47700.1 NAD(P)-dependent dehydrogenase (short-subunit alcohol dehydrogenase family) [Variibacter gotjawalensis]BAT59953.1 cyclic-di-GMP-binding biofilm dispersal mediator protein [Variibacter gotjawalensis]
MSDLSGKRALVTGGSRGIGAAIAQSLAKAGAEVAITYAGSADKAEAVVKAIKASGRKGVAIKADSADAAQIERGVKSAVEALGGLDILVNNAGIARAGEVETISIEDIDALLAVNVRGVVLASRAAIPHLGKGGRIVSIGSNLAERVPFPGLTIYSMTKSALLSFTRGLARELGPRGITVNMVNPGSTDTDMNPADGEMAAAQLAHNALGHFGTPDDIANMVTYLAGPQAKQITGAAFLVDGGFNA